MLNDLTKLLGEVRVPEKSHVDMIKRRAMGTSQWFLERDVETHAIYNNNHLQFFICGQEGFASIQKDILAAKYSIDLVLWGFDPGMELVRDDSLGMWPRGMTYGDLLTQKARNGVKVRLLIWYPGNALEMASPNMPDLGFVSPIPPFWGSHNDKFVAPKTAGMSMTKNLEARAQYGNEWMTLAIRGHFRNLEIRFRDADADAIAANSAKYLPSLMATVTEGGGALAAGTHHQKPVLIDYGSEKDGNTCAYVMGLNSVTDYWDTDQHLFNDRKRELHADCFPDPDHLWHIKPYRDYAVRITGEALYSVNQNFVEGWDNAQGYAYGHSASLKKKLFETFGVPMPEAGPLDRNDLNAERMLVSADALPAAPGARSRVQILRTFPDKLEATILKAYALASSNAVNYIYIENQYVQLTEWPRLLKKTRQDYLDGMRAAGAAPAAIKKLYIFIVMPQPERNQMIPNTYDTIGALGEGGDMKNYNASVQGVRKGEFHANPILPSFRSARDVPLDPQAELQALGINVAVAMLMTYDKNRESGNILYKGDRESSAQIDEAKQETKKNKENNARKGQAGDVDLSRDKWPKGLKEYNVRPRPYREIYIHSKLMMVDDTFMTVGSANLNPRSMVGDSEFNICTDDQAFTQEARRRVWENLAGSDLDGGSGIPDKVKDTHRKWQQRMLLNRDHRLKGQPPESGSFIHQFEDARHDPGYRLA